MAASSHLDPIDCSIQPLDISFHPKRQHLVAAALVDGTLEVHDFAPLHRNDDDDDDSSEHDTIVSSIPLHTQQQLPLPSFKNNGKVSSSCRSVLFSRENGSQIYTGGSHGDICGMDAEMACSINSFGGSRHPKPLWRVNKGGDDGGIQTMYQLLPNSPTGPLLATGSDEGVVRLWDLRLCGSHDTNKRGACVMSWQDCFQDYISSFCQAEQDVNTLLCSSADGTLGVFDLRKVCASSGAEKRNSLRQSDNQDDELLSIQVLKHGKKVVCGTQEGVLAVWSWGVWGDVSDRFPGHPASIDALLKVDQDTVLTGCSDGLLRLVQIHPDKLLGVLGDHEGFPIEKLEFNATKSHVGTTSHDTLIRLWDTSMLQDNDDQDSNDEENEQDRPPMKRVAAVARGTGQDSDDEWEHMDDNDDDDDMADESDDSDDSDEDKGVTTNNKRAKKFKSETEKFFEDL